MFILALNFVFLGICLTAGFTFFILAMIVGQALLSRSQKKPKSVAARVEKLSKVHDELKAELPQNLGGKVKVKKSLLSSVDLKPLLSKFTGEAYFSSLETNLAQAGLTLRVSEFLILRGTLIFIGCVVTILLTKNILFGLLAIIPLCLIHIPFIRFLKKARVNKFGNQLAEFLILVVNSLRAGQTFMQGAEVAAGESPEPIAGEFKQVLKEVNLGIPVETSMDNMLVRVPSEDLKIVVAAYTIQRKVGGNLATIFETTAATIRERIRIQGQINTLTTQGKLSGVIVAIIPFVIGIALYTLMPDIMQEFLGSLFGKIAVGIALTLQAIGAFAIKKIVSIEI
jgi:tight adherence protein B